jgi:hypothetical protein
LTDLISYKNGWKKFISKKNEKLNASYKIK